MQANFVTFVRNAIAPGPGAAVVAATQVDSSTPVSRGVRRALTRAQASSAPVRLLVP